MPDTTNPQADPLTAEQLDLIEARAAHLYEYPAHAVDVEILTGTEVPALLAEVRRLRDHNTELETGLNDLAHLVSHWYNRAQEAKARVADEAPQPETQADEDRCAHGCDVSICPCLACEAEQPATEVETPCTCAAAGDCFAPSGHYADCPQAEQPAAVSQPGKEN